MKIGRYSDSPRRIMRGTLLALTLTLGMLLGHSGWVSEFMHLRAWLPALPNDDLPILAINMPYNGYYQILRQRDESLASGVYIGQEEDFQAAEITYNRQIYPVRMRLQEGTTNQLGDSDKWNWEVRLRLEGNLLGMRTFHLLDPTENNWLHQYAFAKALEKAGILVSRYEFVRLYINGADMGIYAMQEGMTVNLPLRQNLPAGVIVEFDSRQLWQGVRYFGGDEAAAFADPVTNLNATDLIYFQVDSFQIAAGANNADLNEHAQEAIRLLRGLQTGEISASEVFDVEKYGRFLALSDLWGAIDGTSLVNLRYYFNPFTYRLEPIGYNGNPLLAGNQRISLDSTYNSLPLQIAYVQAAEQFSNPAYLAQLQDELAAELDPLLTALQRENPSVTLPWPALRQRQTQIQRSLAPNQPIFVYLNTANRASEGYMEIEVANVTSLAVELVGFQINETIFLPANREWLVNPRVELLVPQDEQLVLAPNQRGGANFIRYVRFQIPLTAIRAADPTADFLTTPTVHVGSRLAGLSTEPQWTTAVPTLP